MDLPDEDEMPKQMLTIAQQEEERLAKEQDEQDKLANAQIASRLGLPFDAPQWMEKCHLDFYGGFARDWTIYY